MTPEDFRKRRFFPRHWQVSEFNEETAELPQGLHDICPSKSLKVLFGQGEQSLGLVARRMLPILPVGQRIGSKEPSGQYDPKKGQLSNDQDTFRNLCFEKSCCNIHKKLRWHYCNTTFFNIVPMGQGLESPCPLPKGQKYPAGQRSQSARFVLLP